MTQDEQEVQETASVQFGAKTITAAGSLSMLLNNILGPGIAAFPALFQQAGWLCPTLFIILSAGCSLLSGEMLVIAMRRMPGNEHFQRRVEYSTMCSHYLRPVTAKVCMVIFQLAMLSANISNIIQTAQVFDQTIDSIFSDSCAMEFYPKPFRFFCGTNGEDVTPFGTGKVLLSIGASVVAVFSIPLGYWNLEDNMVVQNISMMLIAVCMVMWLGIFFALGLVPSRVPVFRAEDGISSLHGTAGTVLFNFMFISTLPSWVCEKHPSVNTKRTVGMALLLSVIMFIAVGVTAGCAFKPYYGGDNDNTLLSEMHKIKNRTLHWIATVSVDVYAISANLASIPIYSIMMRYNLIEQKMMGPRWAGIVAVVLPWMLSVLLYCGEGFSKLIEIAGSFTAAVVNLIVPSLFFLIAIRRPLPTEISSSQSACPPDGDNAWSLQMTLASGTPSHSASLHVAEEGADDEVIIPHDWSGHIRTKKGKKCWVIGAWANVVIMTMVSVLAMSDEVAG